MALKYKFKTREEIPAELTTFYIERDGAFVLDAENVVEKSKLDEFRTNNVTLMKERDDLMKRFDGIDPDAVRKLAAEKQRLEDEQRIKDGKFQEVLEVRLNSARTEWNKQFSTVTAERDALHSQLATIQIDQAIVSEASKYGLRATAIPDITARARTVFKLVNGVPQALEADGKTVRAGKDGVAPMTLAEWVNALVSDAPHLFEGNSGGAGMKNPFCKETWNLTEQMKLQKSDPGLAARLKAAA